jgi:hypothetical protein
LSKILELPMDSRADSQLIQRHENPTNSRSSIRNSQLTVSKAFAMAIFKGTPDRLRVWINFADNYTALKLP